MSACEGHVVERAANQTEGRCVTLLRVRAKNHPQQITARGRNDAADDRRTPDDLWDELHHRFKFTLDAAASAENAKLACHLSREADALVRPWGRHRVWCNPPYSDLSAWVSKAWQEMRAGCPLIVMLLPANRCEQQWWQAWVEPYRDKPGARFGPMGEDLRGAVTLKCEFLAGRLRFKRPGWVAPAKGDRPPFGCTLLIWRRA